MLSNSLRILRPLSARCFSATRYAAFNNRNFPNNSHSNANSSILGDPLFEEPDTPRGFSPSSSASSPASTAESKAVLAFPEEEEHSYHLPSSHKGDDSMEGPKKPLLDEQALAALSAPVDESLVEIKPDGAVYLPEVHYRRVLTQAFGPLGWLLWPRGPHTLLSGGTVLTREYVLVCKGHVVATARGSATLHGHTNAAQATESVKSNALMRTCKDLGIASELWDSRFVAQWRERFATRRQLPNSNKMVFVKKTE